MHQRTSHTNAQWNRGRLIAHGFLVGVCVVLAVAGLKPLLAQEARRLPPDTGLAPVPGIDLTETDKLLGTLMSPFCPGLTLANCPSLYAETLRVSIRNRLAAGEPADSIVESLVAAFGEGVRAAPRASGVGLVLWIAPLLALGLGAVGLTWWLRRRALCPPDLPPDPSLGEVSEPTAADRARVEAALRDYD